MLLFSCAKLEDSRKFNMLLYRTIHLYENLFDTSSSRVSVHVSLSKPSQFLLVWLISQCTSGEVYYIILHTPTHRQTHTYTHTHTYYYPFFTYMYEKMINLCKQLSLRFGQVFFPISNANEFIYEIDLFAVITCTVLTCNPFIGATILFFFFCFISSSLVFNVFNFELFIL